MTLDQAHALAEALAIAITDAEADGSDQVSLTQTLQQLDDAARDELQAAIDSHGG